MVVVVAAAAAHLAGARLVVVVAVAVAVAVAARSASRNRIVDLGSCSHSSSSSSSHEAATLTIIVVATKKCASFSQPRGTANLGINACRFSHDVGSGGNGPQSNAFAQNAFQPMQQQRNAFGGHAVYKY